MVNQSAQLSLLIEQYTWHIIVYAHGRRLCSNWIRHRSTTISYPQCSLTFMRERYLHRSFAYAKSAVGIDVVSVHKLFAYRVVSTVNTDILLTRKSGVLGSIPGLATYFRFSFRFFKKGSCQLLAKVCARSTG